MPYSYKGKHGQEIHNGSHLTDATTSERDEDVPCNPPIEASVPAAPKGQSGIVVTHATDHVLWWINTVEQAPESEEAPRK